MSLEILIIRLSALGDVVHTLPVAAVIKRYLPDAKITWVVQSPASPLLINNPAVDRVIIFPGKSVQPASVTTPPAVFYLKQLSDFWKEFKSHKYDIAIDAQGLFKSALLCWLSGAKRRIGFAKTREWADKFLTHPVDVGDYFGNDIHIVDINLKLVVKLFELLGNNVPASWIAAQFPLPAVPEDVRQTTQRWLNNGAPPKHRLDNIVLIPGTTWDTKIWPIEKWQELGRLLLDNNDCRVIICGGNSELTINKKLEKHLTRVNSNNVVNLTGKTSLLELIAIFEQAKIVIGADSGPTHLACAVGKSKVIAIHGATPWKRNGPYGKKGYAIALNLDCQPCFQKKCPLHTLACLNELSAKQVYEEVIEFADKQ